MKKFKVGDKVKLTEKAIKWQLSEEGQSMHYPPHRDLTKEELKELDRENLDMMQMLIEPGLFAIVENVNWPNSLEENYKVGWGNTKLNVEAKDLRRFNK